MNPPQGKETLVTILIPTPRPIVAAPMAGGPTTVALALAVAEAGGFPFLAGGYKTAEALHAEIQQLQAKNVPLGVNIFVPSNATVDPAALSAYADELAPEAEHYGLQLDPCPISDDDHWDDKIALLTTHPVPVVSFTFGLPPRGIITTLHEHSTQALITVTTPDEAVAATEHGADGLIIQGPAAGGHSATFDPTRTPQPEDLPTLVCRVRTASPLPVIAAGGIDDAEAVRAALDTGTIAVAVGTLLLRTDEAGTSATHRAALADPALDDTTITHAFTGRPARALTNDFITQHHATAPHASPPCTTSPVHCDKLPPKPATPTWSTSEPGPATATHPPAQPPTSSARSTHSPTMSNSPNRHGCNAPAR